MNLASAAMISFLPDTCSNKGNNNKVRTVASASAMNDINMASPRNCLSREVFCAPRTFLTPTSAALLAEFAVDRFMKLIQAINNVSKAMEPRINNRVLLPDIPAFLADGPPDR